MWSTDMKFLKFYSIVSCYSINMRLMCVCMCVYAYVLKMEVKDVSENPHSSFYALPNTPPTIKQVDLKIKQGFINA